MHALEQQVKQTIEQFSMMTPEDRILVAVSGGKDSTVLLHVLHKLRYSIEAITVDAQIGCYTKKNLENIRKMTSKLGVKLHEISFREEFGYSLCYLKAVLQSKGFTYKSCSVCGVLRRWLLNKHARTLGATKIATGHNLDDEAQVVLMNFLKGNPSLNARMGPVSGIKEDKKFVQRIKPLYLTRERDIVAYSKEQEFPVHYGICPCSTDSFRRQIRNTFDAMEFLDGFKENIMQSFLKMQPKLQAYAQRTALSVQYCKDCGEPASGRLCRACKILEELASDSKKPQPAEKGVLMQPQMITVERMMC